MKERNSYKEISISNSHPCHYFNVLFLYHYAYVCIELFTHFTHPGEINSLYLFQQSTTEYICIPYFEKISNKIELTHMSLALNKKVSTLQETIYFATFY